MRRAAWVLWFVVLGSSLAHAQGVPAPPLAYTSASIGLDLVLEPLMSAAEADLAAGRIDLAIARAEVVLDQTPGSSSVHVRAEGLVLLARQTLGERAPEPVDPSEVLVPLVARASDDVTASRFDLARARLDWLAAHVPAEGPLGPRVRGTRAALDVRAASGTSSTATPSTIIVTPPPGGAFGVDAERPEPPAAEPTSHHHPRHRTDLEMVDLYVSAGLMGAYLGAWIPVGTGIFDRASGDDVDRIAAVAMLGGAGVTLLAVFGLDQIGDGPHLGQPTSIAAGIRFGFVLSGLTLGVLAAEHDYRTSDVFGALGVGLIGGTAIGAIFAYAAEPHPAQVQFTQATGVWGGLLGAELAALITPLAFPNFGASRDRMETGFGITLGALSAGLVTGMIASVAHENFSARRSWLTTLGLVAGTAGGSLIWLLESILDHGNFDLPAWGGLAGVFGLGGLVLAAALTDGDRGARDFDEPPPIQISVAPTIGGATLGFSGTL